MTAAERPEVIYLRYERATGAAIAGQLQGFRDATLPRRMDGGDIKSVKLLPRSAIALNQCGMVRIPRMGDRAAEGPGRPNGPLFWPRGMS
jgi:hypothetical protein